MKLPFIYRMRVMEFYSALLYLPIHSIIIPILFSWHAYSNPNMYTETEYNLAYYVFSFAVILVICRRYLRLEYDGLMDGKIRSAIVFLQGQGLYIVGLLLLVSFFSTTGIDPSEYQSPNNEAIDEMAKLNSQAVMAFGIFLAPLVEEVLFRGVVFGRIRLKHRALAYIVSTILFAILHVWQFAVNDFGAHILIYAIYYIPSGLVLAWCYERSGTIWIPIFVHMTINNMAFSVVQ